MSYPMEPTVGRIVHYVSYGTPGGEYTKECRAAVVTTVGGESATGLCVLNPTGAFFNKSVIYDEGEEPWYSEDEAKVLECTGRLHRGGTWHWPARVE